MKLIFMGTPDFSVNALEAIIAEGHEVLAVYSQPPRPSGRGHKLRKSPLHLAAEKHNIPVRTPVSLKNKGEQEEFASFGADAAVVVAYGLLLPKAILDICPCFNIHASLLPRWRGAAPIQRSIISGDIITGVTIMKMDEGLDTGDMIIWEEIPINSMNAKQLHDALSVLGSRLIVEALDKISKGEIKFIKQEGEATYAKKITKEEPLIDFNKSANELDCFIRGFSPHPGAYFIYNDEKFKILSAEFEEKSTGFSVGEVINENLDIAIKDGLIRPVLIQRQGKKSMPLKDMLRGFSIPVGTKL